MTVEHRQAVKALPPDPTMRRNQPSLSVPHAPKAHSPLVDFKEIEIRGQNKVATVPVDLIGYLNKAAQASV